jgi:hypothetical protein
MAGCYLLATEQAVERVPRRAELAPLTQGRGVSLDKVVSQRLWLTPYSRNVFLLTVAFGLSQSFPNGARAIDIFPRDYVPFPAGTNLTALYYLYSDSNMLNLAGGETIRNGTKLQSNTGVLRQIYYGDLGGHSWAAQLLLPVATVNGEIAGNHLQGASGLGDVVASWGISLLPHVQPDRNVGIVLYTSFPTGNYRSDRTLNVGSNRWSFDTQIGYTQALGQHFWFDAAADAILYTLNRDVGPGHATLAQQPSYQAQVWFSYVPGLRSLISVGAAAQFGGVQSIDQISNGLKTESEQIRLGYWYAVTPAFHLAGVVSHDLHAVGGFPQTIGLTLRAVYLF